MLAAFVPGSPATPYLVRVLVACLVAASVSHLLGVGRPYWAVVAAIAIMQPSSTLTWHRAPGRAVGTALGVLAFVALVPLTHQHVGYAVATVLLLNAVVELVIPRSYLLGQFLVTPMALLVTELVRPQPAGAPVVDRLVDTLVGVAIGVVVTLVVPNPHLHRRVGNQVRSLEAAVAAAAAVTADPQASHAQATAARHLLYDELASLHLASSHAGGEWWAPLPDDAATSRAVDSAHAVLRELRKDEVS